MNIPEKNSLLSYSKSNHLIQSQKMHEKRKMIETNKNSKVLCRQVKGKCYSIKDKKSRTILEHDQ